MKPWEVARGLGWFSIGLGVGEILFGKKLGRLLGLPHRAGTLRLFGLREIAAGAGIVSREKPPAEWVWARVAGDVLDLGLLLTALRKTNARRGTAAVAFGNVAAITALDWVTARQLPA